VKSLLSRRRQNSKWREWSTTLAIVGEVVEADSPIIEVGETIRTQDIIIGPTIINQPMVNEQIQIEDEEERIIVETQIPKEAKRKPKQGTLLNKATVKNPKDLKENVIIVKHQAI